MTEDIVTKIAREAMRSWEYSITSHEEIARAAIRLTVEACRSLADEQEAMRLQLFNENDNSINAHKAVQAEVISQAIRTAFNLGD